MSRNLSRFTLIVAAMTSPLAAQTQPSTPGLGGSPVPGVCLLSREAIYANATVGKAANVQLKQISDQAQAEIDAERKPLEAELQAFRTEAPKLAAEQRRSREQALSARLQPIQAKAQLRSREIEATRTKALQRIANEAQPLIAQAYKARNCGLLVDRATVLGGNMTNDLTPAVVQALNAKISTITFSRETLPAQTAAR